MNDLEIHTAETHATFWDHLDELRKTLIAVLTIISISTIICFIFYRPILEFFGAPLRNLEKNLDIEEYTYRRVRNLGSSPIQYKYPSLSTSDSQITIPLLPGEEIEISVPVKKESLVILSPLEGMTVTLKICFWLGLIASSPLWLLSILRFIAPGLNSQSNRFALPFLLLSQLFFGLGFLFAYFVTLPLANQYLYSFNLEIGDNLWGFSHYFDYTILMLLANGLGAELSLILFFLVHLGILSSEVLIAKRRHAILAAFVIGALLTPPDILTQFMVAIPILLCYELAIWYGHLRKRYIGTT